MKRPLLCALPGNERFARRLKSRLGWDSLRLQCRRFPDGESYVRLLGNPAGRAVALVCALDRPDEKTLPLLFAADTARDLGASSVGLVAPYLPYLRQDRRFRAGEALTSAAYARQLGTAFDWLVTVDAHLHRLGSLDAVYPIPTREASAAGAIAAWIRRHVARPLVVGPDSESERWAAAIGSEAGAPHIVLAKRRRGDRAVRVTAPALGPWRGHTPVLVDDIISTARTMAAAARLFCARDFPPAVCIGVHAVFAGDGLAALRDARVSRILTANTIPHATNVIDVSEAVAEALRAVLAVRPRP